MKCVYVFNPTSGKQNSEKNREYVLRALKSKFSEVEVHATTKRGDAAQFAKEACGVADVLVVSGGDGTMNEVIGAIASEPVRPKIGYIPSGTTNDLAHSLRLPKNVKKAVKIILKGNTTTHDIFRAGSHFGIYVCCFGIFTGASYNAPQSSKKKFGWLAYFKSGASEIFTSEPVHVKLSFDDQSLEGDFALGIIGNSRYVAGYKINDMACCNDGFVNVVLVRNKKKHNHVSVDAIIRIFRLFLFGMRCMKNNKNVSILRLKKFQIELPENCMVNLDGEAGFRGGFEFEVLKEHVEIFVKRRKNEK